MMRALPLWPEWAYMAVSGVKSTETRSRPLRTLVGERIVIHATLSGPTPDGWPWNEYALGDVARGALVGTVRVTEMWQMTDVYCRGMREREPREHALGDYAPGRWAFQLTEPRRFARPVPWRGKQGVFMVPDEVVRSASLPAWAQQRPVLPGCYD